MKLSLDDEFFESVGLASLSAEGKRSLATAIYRELELRVGLALSDGMSDEQMNEFERIIDRDEDAVRKILDEHDHENYQHNRDKPLAVLADAASNVWLAVNRRACQVFCVSDRFFGVVYRYGLMRSG